jgi:hypothetical protein
MSHTVRLKVIADVPIHGVKPGQEFDVEADNDGMPINYYWRRRLDDERQFAPGVVCILDTHPSSLDEQHIKFSNLIQLLGITLISGGNLDLPPPSNQFASNTLIANGGTFQL